MKQKLITALRTKYQRFGLSNEAIDRIASAKEKTVTSEDDIETAIADVETMELIANELQKSADAERRKGSDVQKSFDDYKKKYPENTQTQQAQQQQQAEEPEWAKKLRESNERIEARFAAEDAAKRNADILTEIETKLKAAISESSFNQGVFKSTLKGFALKDKEEIEDAVVRLKADYDANLRETFGDGPIPGVSVQAFGDAKAATDAKNKFLKEQGLLPKDEQK